MAQPSRDLGYLRTFVTGCIQHLNQNSGKAIDLLKFYVDGVDHDALLIFWLEHHIELKCSRMCTIIVHSPSVRDWRTCHFHRSALWIWGWSTNEVLFSNPELRKLQTIFGYPSREALVILLAKEKRDNTDSEVWKKVQKIADKCGPCGDREEHDSSNRRHFK